MTYIESIDFDSPEIMELREANARERLREFDSFERELDDFLTYAEELRDYGGEA